MEAKNLTRRQIQELIVEYTAAISKLEFQIATAQKTIEDLEKNLDSAPITATTASSKRSTAKPKKKRGPGRPKKAASKKATTSTASKPAKRRGRPPKAKSATTAATKKATPTKAAKKTTKASTTAAKPKAKRGPGRPRKAASTAKTKKATTAKRATTAKKATSAKKATTPKKASTAKKGTATKKSTTAKPKMVKKLEEKTSGYRLSDWDAHVIDTFNKSGKVLSKNEICDAAEKWAKGKKLGMDSKQVYTKVSNVLHKLTNKKNILNRFSNDKIKNSYGLSGWFTPQGNLRDEHLS